MSNRKTEDGNVKKDDPLAEAREKFDKAITYWNDDREAALDDIRFRAGKQWDDEIRKQRISDKRPCLTVDKLNQYVRQIVNDGRQNRPGIKVRPVDSGADIATAEVFQGIIRHIEDASNADAAYDTALDCSATNGFGFFRVLSDYDNAISLDQSLFIRRIRNPLSVIIDPMAQECDGSDMKYAFVIEDMDKEVFEATYPGKMPDNWESDKGNYGDWFGETIRVAEHWWVETNDVMLYKLDDGTTIDQEKKDAAESAGIPIVIVETRKVQKKTVKWCKMSGSAYLDEPKVWPGKYIPIMVVWGNEIDVEGKVIHSGIIRPAKDPQRLYNYSRSAFAERVALTPKAPWVAAEGQIDSYENEWKTANVENHSVLRYTPKSLNGQPVPPPQRQTASDIPAGFAQDMQISEHDIQAAIGMYAASLGAPSNERSGKAIMARQREGDVGTFHYHDNLNRSIRHCGRVLVDLIPYFYDSTRMVRILGEDGSADQIKIDPMLPVASNKVGTQMFYNLGVGTYDVTISAGPSYTSLRQEQSAAMIEMVQANPALMQVAGDLIIKAQDWPGANELSERLKLTLPPEIQEAEARKKLDKLPPEMARIVSQMEMVIAQKEQMMQEAMQQIEQLMMENEKVKADAQSKLMVADAKQREVKLQEKELVLRAVETEIKAYDSETDRISALAKVGSDQTTMPPMPEEPVNPQTVDMSPIIQSIQALQQSVAGLSRPARTKTGKAVKLPDGTWAMEAREFDEPMDIIP